MTWRYLVERLDGAGGGSWLSVDATLIDPEITTALSAPGELTAKFQADYFPQRAEDGLRFFEPWSTAVWADDGANIYGGIVTMVGSGETPSLHCVGPAGYPNGLAYTGARYWVERDPIDIFREVWAELQGFPRGNLGLTFDDTKSGKLVGVQLEQVEFDTQNGPLSFESGPWKLNWYSDGDVGQRLEDLRAGTPFDYREQHRWSADRGRIEHHLEIGYPSLGARRTDLVFELGTNLYANPDANNDGTDYMDYAVVVGAGEGAAAVNVQVPRGGETRLRRPRMISDKSITSKTVAYARAARELSTSLGEYDITQVAVIDHPNAPVGSWQNGDQVMIDYDVLGRRTQEWVRIVSTTIKPDSPDAAVLTIERVGGSS